MWMHSLWGRATWIMTTSSSSDNHINSALKWSHHHEIAFIFKHRSVSCASKSCNSWYRMIYFSTQILVEVTQVTWRRSRYLDHMIGNPCERNCDIDNEKLYNLLIKMACSLSHVDTGSVYSHDAKTFMFSEPVTTGLYITTAFLELLMSIWKFSELFCKPCLLSQNMDI